ncbi:MAG TPA: hypothetical protein VF483_06305 [Gemmatimonadaceae bacterium]
MAINTGKVVVGGIAATVVNMAVGFVAFQMMLGAKFAAEMEAAMPGAAAKMSASPALNFVGPVVNGFLVAWLYAAMRPRFGPGMKTAMMAALPVWIGGAVFFLNDIGLGMMSWGTYVTASLAALVMTVAAAAAAGAVYKEEGA